jgi:transcriptional regulator with XRE-family HTH domain
MLQNITIKDVKNSLGKLVKILRDRENLTQEQLGNKLGMSRLTIQKLEAGKNPTIDTLLKILQYFDLLPGFEAYITSEMNLNNQQSLY